MAGVVATVTETEYAGHCEDAIRDLDVSKVDLIISVSGDGMLHELVNGIMKRDDWHQATKVPIGVIPCGTGNALASSLMYPTPIISILTLIKRQWRPFDLMAAYQYTPPAIPSTIDDSAPTGVTSSQPAPKLASQKKSSSKAMQTITTTSNAPTADSANPADQVGEDVTSSTSKPISRSDSKRKSKKASKESEIAPDTDSSSAQAQVTQASSTDESSAPTSETKATPQQSHKKSKSQNPVGGAPSASAEPSTPITSPSGSRLLTKAAIARQARAHATKGPPTPGTWNLICYSFQALMWGIISDVDIETEPWRWMGDFRFTLGAVRRVAAMRHYPARLFTLDSADAGDHMATCQFHSVCNSCSDGHHEHYNRHERLEKHFAANETTVEKVIVHERIVLDADDALSDEKVVSVVTETETIVEKPPRRKKSKVIEGSETPSPTSETPTAPAESTVSGASNVAAEEEPLTTKTKKPKARSKSELPIETEPSSTADTTKHKRKKSKKKEQEVEEIDEIPTGEAQAETASSSAVASKAPSASHTASTPMRGLAKGLDTIIDFDPMQPNTEIDTTRWSDITTRFVYFVASNVSHIGTDLRVAPFSHTCGGTVDVVYADEVPKLSMLDLLTSMENGRYVGHSSVTYKKVKAFLLIPTGKPGVIDLDGEEYEPLPTAIEVHTGVLRMVTAIWNLSLAEEDL